MICFWSYFLLETGRNSAYYNLASYTIKNWAAMLIMGVIELNATRDHLPYLCPTKFLLLAMPLQSAWALFGLSQLLATGLISAQV